jgi:STE24 endopeptidase
MVLIGSYVFVVFGFVSRRCERQADVYGCRAVSAAEEIGEPRAVSPGDGLHPDGIRTFIAALDKVAAVNGINRRRPGLLNAWLHGTIARRVEFLEGVLADQQVERRFQRRLSHTKWALLIVLAAGVIAMAAAHWDEIGPLLWPG